MLAFFAYDSYLPHTGVSRSGDCVLLRVFGYNHLAAAEVGVGVRSLAVHQLLEITSLLEIDATHLSHTDGSCDISHSSSVG